jgi:LysR family transcriptional regulator of abg operon
MIDPRLMRTYLAVCRAQSISRAARALNISQPSVSVAINQLERTLKTVLFSRSRLGIKLTDAGIALQRRAEFMESLLRDTEDEIALVAQGVAGPLRVGGTPGALVSLVPLALARIDPTQRLSLHILERPDLELTELLRKGEIEVAVMTTGIEAPPPDIEERSIARDPFALIVGRAHESIGATVSLRETLDWGWVLPQAAGAFHRQIEALFLAAEVAVPSDVIRCDSLLTSKAIVQEGGRVTMLPRGVVAAELSIGVLRAIPISDAAVVRNVGIRILANRPLSHLGAQFVAAVEVTHNA